MIIDVIVIAILLISAIIAFLRGLIREVLTIAGVVGGLIAAYFGGPLLIPFMRGWLGVEEGKEPERLFDILPYDVIADALSYGLIFILVVIILSVASHFLAESIKKLGLGAVDRTLGFIFGLLRGILIVGILYIPVTYIDEETKETYVNDSKTRVYLEKTSAALLSFLPEDTKETIEEGAKDINNDISKGIETRDKLEEIDLLKEHREREATPENGSAGNGNSGGYDQDFRNKMNELFKDNAQTPEKPNAPE